MLEWFAEQSVITDPGRHSDWIGELPRSLEELTAVVRNLVVHRDRVRAELVGKGRLRDEPTFRRVQTMLDRLRALDPSPPNHHRDAGFRLVGHCRTSSVLLCSFLRLQGVAARTRCGFSVYYADGREFYGDHWVVEYWSVANRRWQLIDAELDLATRQEHDITFDPTDIPRDQLLMAATAWQRGRSDDAVWRWFGSHPGDASRTYVAGQLLRDASSLIRLEPGAFDNWAPSDLEEAVGGLDQLATITLADPSPHKVRALFDAQDLLAPPASALVDL
jgi:Transglutaminase-like superfamily